MRILIVLAFSISACGVDPLTLINAELPPLPTVVKITEEDIANELALPNSYLVAFRDDRPYALHFHDFQSEYTDLAALLDHESYSDPRIASINPISNVDLRAMKPESDDHHKLLPPQLLLGFADKPTPALNSTIAEVTFNSAEDAADALAEWEATGKIWFADPNYTNELADAVWDSYQEKYKQRIDGNNLNYAWHKQIRTLDAFTALTGATSDQPIIAVMDSGVDVKHPKIKDRIWQNEESLGVAGCSDDYNGCNTTKARKGLLGDGDVFPHLTSAHGEACPLQGNTCEKECCHGTHVAGIIAADADESVAGVCPVCRIMVVKVVGEATVGLDGKMKSTILDGWIGAGLKYVASFRKGSPVRVINASFGKFGRSRAVAALVSTLVDTPKGRGPLIIGAAGNEDTLKMQYPAAFNEAIAVSNIDRDSNKAATSNFGSWVDVAAPGMNIMSTIPGGQFEPKSGTSMAAPVVSGIAGLVLLKNPDISTSQLRAAILNTADPVIYQEGKNADYLVKVPTESSTIPLLGTGLVNAGAAVKGAESGGRPVVRTPDRVKPGCGTIGARNAHAASYYSLLTILLFIPALMVLAPTLRHYKKNSHTI